MAATAALRRGPWVSSGNKTPWRIHCAYNTPNERIVPTAVLTFQFICTFHSIGTGSRAKTTSVRTETLELKNAANLRCDGGMHVPVAVPPQVKARGLHWKKTVTARVSLY